MASSSPAASPPDGSAFAAGGAPPGLSPDDFMGDAALSADAEHVGEAPAAMQADTALEDNARQLAIIDDLNRLGLDFYRNNFPDAANMNDHRDIFAFWGIRLSPNLQISDVSRRRRLAALLLHPDKFALASPTMQLWAGAQMRQLNLAFDIVCQRISWIRDRRIWVPAPSEYSFPFQEVPDAFGAWFGEHYDLDFMVTNTSEGLFWAAGRLQEPPVAPPLAEAIAFFNSLFSSENDRDLLDLIRQVSNHVVPKGTLYKFGLVAQKFPRDFLDWLQRQLGRLRNEGYLLHIFFCGFVDALPAPWERLTMYVDSPFISGNRYQPYRLNIDLLEPAMMTVITAGSGQLRLLKKVWCAGFSTCDRVGVLAEEPVRASRSIRWKRSRLDPFTSSIKLYLDFAKGEELQVNVFTNLLGAKFGGITPPYQSRSFGDSPALKRKLQLVTFPPSFDIENPDFYRWVGQVLVERGLSIAVAWETVFSVPEGSYVLSVDNLKFVMDPHVFNYFAQVAVVSKRRVIVVFNITSDVDTIIDFMVAWNQEHPDAAFTRLENYVGERIWAQSRLPPQSAFEPRRPPSWPAPARHDITLRLRGHDEPRLGALVDGLLKGAGIALRNEGYTGSLTAFFRYYRGVPENRVLVASNDEDTARAFFYRFRNYPWENDLNTQVVYVELFCALFEAELETPALRRYALLNDLTPEQSRSVRLTGTLALAAPPSTSTSSAAPSSSSPPTTR